MEEKYTCPVCREEKTTGITHDTGRETNDCIVICPDCSNLKAEQAVFDAGIKSCSMCGFHAHYTDMVYIEHVGGGRVTGSYYCHDCEQK